tara:strand:- start:273 stop:512 length:240 start_codon:yes stop_codon:yes gene_type:complete
MLSFKFDEIFENFRGREARVNEQICLCNISVSYTFTRSIWGPLIHELHRRVDRALSAAETLEGEASLGLPPFLNQVGAP